MSTNKIGTFREFLASAKNKEISESKDNRLEKLFDKMDDAGINGVSFDDEYKTHTLYEIDINNEFSGSSKPPSEKEIIKFYKDSGFTIVDITYKGIYKVDEGYITLNCKFY